MADRMICKSCLVDFTLEDVWRATVLLSDGTTTDVTICDDCISSLSENLTKVRRHANEMLAAERAISTGGDPALRDARDLRYIDNAWLYVFGARRWTELAADRLQVAL